MLRLVRADGGETAQLGQVLVIDHRIPTPDRDCGSLCMVEIMCRIRQAGHHVVLVPDNPTILTPYIQDLQSEGIEVVLPPQYPSVEAYLEQHGHDFELAIISRADIAEKHMATVRRPTPRARIVFDTVDLHFLREERQAELDRTAGRRETRGGNSQGSRASPGTNCRSHPGCQPHRKGRGRKGMRQSD